MDEPSEEPEGRVSAGGSEVTNVLLQGRRANDMAGKVRLCGKIRKAIDLYIRKSRGALKRCS